MLLTMPPYRQGNTVPFRRWSSVTAMSLLLLLFQVALAFMAVSPEQFWWYENFGLSWNEFSHGKIWQLLTYALLHGDWSHLLVNLCMLLLVGNRVLTILGRKKFYELIVAGVLVGGIFHLLTSVVLGWKGYSESYLVGISGACFALLLALIAVAPHARMRFIPVSGKNLGLGVVIAEAMMWLMHPGLGLPVFSALGEQMVHWGGAALFKISHACHLGGALAGWWMARRVLAPVVVR